MVRQAADIGLISKRSAHNLWLAITVIVAFLLSIVPEGLPHYSAYIALGAVYLAGNMRIERHD